MFKPKLAIIGAVTGFLLSLLTGLLGGNPFGVVLFRALLMAILFGGLIAALGAVLIRFLPELENPPVSETNETGGVVDITLDDQSERLDPFARPTGDSGDDEDQVPDFLQQARGSRRESPEGRDDSDPVRQPAESPSFIGGAAQVQAARPAGAHGGAHSGASSGGLDILPDLEDFVPVKKADDGDDESPEGFNASSILSGSVPSSGSSPGRDNDSETMAKAIRTILTREP